MKVKLEKDVEAIIRKKAIAKGFKVYDIQGKNPRDNGVTDMLIVNKEGTPLFIEVKKGTKLRTAQKMFQKVVKLTYVAEWKKGQIVISDYPAKDLIDFDEWLLFWE